jgi:hypothetical protein
MPPEPPPTDDPWPCGKCGKRLVHPIVSVYCHVDTLHSRKPGPYLTLTVCGPCSVPVVDALKALLEKRHG